MQTQYTKGQCVAEFWKAEKAWLCFGFVRVFFGFVLGLGEPLEVVLKRILGLFETGSGVQVMACPVGNGRLDC